ncbi:5204_t:CDS:2, partial [Paraglomus occultum]
TLYHDATTITREIILEEQDTPVVTVVNGDCLLEGLELKKKGFNPIVLNMACPTVPGGGYGHGAGAQEENLFRRTNLFRYHEPKRKEWYPLPPLGGIYCPNAIVIRNSEQLAYCWLEEPETMSFVAVAAVRRPKLIRDRFGELTLTDQNKSLTRDKIKAILNIGLDNGHDAIVLSAFGCGAFCNPPATVAQLFWEVISSGYAGGVEQPKTYRHIVFAIFDDHNANRRHNDEGNLIPFQRRFAQGLNGPDRIVVRREEREDQGRKNKETNQREEKDNGKGSRSSFFSRRRPSK